MRIIAGSVKGRILYSPKGKHIRPTSDRIKEALFSIIAYWLNGAKVLDLYAGTGSLGIEGLSRGASGAVFVDRDRESVRTIKKNLQITNYTSKATIIQMDADLALTYLAENNFTFDIIFMDPPYGKIEVADMVGKIVLNNLLTQEGIIIIEHSSRDRITVDIAGVELWQRRFYGDSGLSFYIFASKGK